MLGVPTGREEYVKKHLAKKSDERQLLLDRVPLVQDLQTAWLLLFYCARSRVTFLLRSVKVRQQFTADFANAQNKQMWECISQVGEDRKFLGENSSPSRFFFVTWRCGAEQCLTGPDIQRVGRVGQMPFQ